MPFRNMAALAVPSTLEIPTCNYCGNEWIDPKTAEAIDEALQGAYADELHRRLVTAIDSILKVSEIPQRRLEQLLGLSVGYISRLRSGRGDASAPVVSALALLAQDPKRRLRELDQLWTSE